MDKIDMKKLEKLKHEREELLNFLDTNMYDPTSEEYSKIRTSIDWIDRRIESWYKLDKEQEQIYAEYRRCDSDERVAKFQLIGSLGAAGITAASALISNLIKYRIGATTMLESTREAFGMDQEKVQSRVAADSGKKVFDFFFNR